jgi:HNH endonuclease
MTRYVSAELRRLVAERAFEYCEYCRLPQMAAIAKHHIEHIVSLKHGGQTTVENLALACPFCNEQKGTDVGSFDFETDGALTRFFNPRKDVWTEHFQVLESGEIKPLTGEARVMVKILQINNAERIEERLELMEAGIY